MKNSIYNIYNKEIKKIINNENTKAIYLVGSSKNVDLQSDNTSVNDIDLFVFTKNGDKQTRIVKYIENIEFDIIVGYFIINNKWLPKDKKLFKSLKDENIELFRLCKKVIETYEYKDLINVYKYIFI